MLLINGSRPPAFTLFRRPSTPYPDVLRGLASTVL